jgi:hypothetical protein
VHHAEQPRSSGRIATLSGDRIRRQSLRIHADASVPRGEQVRQIAERNLTGEHDVFIPIGFDSV